MIVDVDEPRQDQGTGPGHIIGRVPGRMTGRTARHLLGGGAPGAAGRTSVMTPPRHAT